MRSVCGPGVYWNFIGQSFFVAPGSTGEKAACYNYIKIQYGVVK